jgi:hypothetical protein
VGLNGALASIAFRMGDAADVATLTRLIVRKVLRHLQNDGSDPAAFVRKELDELRITADTRLVRCGGVDVAMLLLVERQSTSTVRCLNAPS